MAFSAIQKEEGRTNNTFVLFVFQQKDCEWRRGAEVQQSFRILQVPSTKSWSTTITIIVTMARIRRHGFIVLLLVALVLRGLPVLSGSTVDSDKGNLDSSVWLSSLPCMAIRLE